MNRPKKIALISSRPQGTNVQLSDDLKNSEIKLLSFPLTEIHPLNNYQIFDGVIENIKTYQHIIFISTNAVHFFVERVKKLSLQIPKNLILTASYGGRQDDLIEKHGLKNVIVYPNAESVPKDRPIDNNDDWARKPNVNFALLDNMKVSKKSQKNN